MNIDQILAIEAKVREHWTYSVTDFNLYHWRSHADEVASGKPWSAPCADLTSTVLDFITKQFPDELANCYRLLCSINFDGVPDHMVGCVLTADNGWWIIGDTFGKGYPVASISHQVLEFNRLSEAGPISTIWRAGKPWDVLNAV